MGRRKATYSKIHWLTPLLTPLLADPLMVENLPAAAQRAEIIEIEGHLLSRAIEAGKFRRLNHSSPATLNKVSFGTDTFYRD